MVNNVDIKNELFDTINNFYQRYPLPPMNITGNEWENFLHIVESHFLAHNIMNDYVHALNVLIRRALYFSQIENANEFTIEHLKKSLCDLVAFKIYSDEIRAMQEECNEKIKKYENKLA